MTLFAGLDKFRLFGVFSVRTRFLITGGNTRGEIADAGHAAFCLRKICRRPDGRVHSAGRNLIAPLNSERGGAARRRTRGYDATAVWCCSGRLALRLETKTRLPEAQKNHR